MSNATITNLQLLSKLQRIKLKHSETSSFTIKKIKLKNTSTTLQKINIKQVYRLWTFNNTTADSAYFGAVDGYSDNVLTFKLSISDGGLNEYSHASLRLALIKAVDSDGNALSPYQVSTSTSGASSFVAPNNDKYIYADVEIVNDTTVKVIIGDTYQTPWNDQATIGSATVTFTGSIILY